MKKLIVSLLLVASVVAVAYAAYTTFTDLKVTHNLVVDNDVSVAGKLTVPYTVMSSTINVSVSTPSYVGQLALNGSYVLYVASGVANPSQWIKVGGQ